jgi:hypothetical protein
MHRVVEVQVRIDETRHDQLVAAIARLAHIKAALQIGALPHGRDFRAAQGNGAVAIDAALLIDGNHRAAGKQRIDLLFHDGASLCRARKPVRI